MNAFGEALNLGFMRRSGDFSSYSSPMEWISDCIPMSSYSRPMNLRLHSHEFKFLFLSQWTQSQTASPWIPVLFLWISDCIPMSSYSQPMNLWMLEFKFLFPCQWISECIPMSSYLPCQILESFGWYHPCPAHPTSGMPIGGQNLAFWRDFGGTPYQYTWVPLKSIVEHFRALLRDFCFSLGFMRISDSSMHNVQYLCGFFQESRVWSPSGWSPSGEVVGGTPDSNMPIESTQLRPERDFRGTTIHTTWVPIKSRRERFRALYGRIAFCG